MTGGLFLLSCTSSKTGVLNPSKSDANVTSDSIVFDSYYDEPVPDGVQVAWGNEG